MVDFRSNAEKAQEIRRAHEVNQDYKQAFENAQSEINVLKSRMETLEQENSELKDKFSEILETHRVSFEILRGQIETGLHQLEDDNKKLHGLIQSAQNQDLELVERMDQNHRARLDSIVKLFDQKGLPHGG